MLRHSLQGTCVHELDFPRLWNWVCRSYTDYATELYTTEPAHTLTRHRYRRLRTVVAIGGVTLVLVVAMLGCVALAEGGVPCTERQSKRSQSDWRSRFDGDEDEDDGAASHGTALGRRRARHSWLLPAIRLGAGVLVVVGLALSYVWIKEV